MHVFLFLRHTDTIKQKYMSFPVYKCISVQSSVRVIGTTCILASLLDSPDSVGNCPGIRVYPTLRPDP